MRTLLLGVLAAWIALSGSAFAQQREAPVGSWVLVHGEDDFTSYANDAAFKAAYPEPASVFGELARLTWSSTNGPGGVPGVANNISGGVLSAAFYKEVTPFGPEIRVVGRFDNSDPPSSSQPLRSARIALYDIYENLTVFSGDGMTGGGASHGDLRTLFSIDPFGTYDPEIDAGAFPANTVQELDIQVKLSAGADGYVRVYVDGVEKVNHTGQVGWDGVTEWWGVGISPGGKFTDLAIYRWAESVSMPETGSLIDHSEPCCDTHGGPNAGPVLEQLATTWAPTLAGGGTIDDPGDLSDAEDWTDQTPPKEPDAWLTIEEDPSPAVSPSDASTTTWGLEPYSDPGRLVEARLREVGAIERGSSDKSGNYAPARARFVVADPDGSVRERLADGRRRHLLHREARYELLSYAGRKAELEPMPVIQGRVVDVQPSINREAVIEVQDIVGSHFGILNPDKMVGLPIGDEHPNLPDATKGHIYNILLGEHFDIPARDCGDEDFETAPATPITRISRPLNLTGELIGAGSGSRTYYYAIVALTEFGHSPMSDIVSVSGCPDSLDVDTYVQLNWDPPAVGEDFVIAYWVLGRTARTPNKRLDTMNNGGTFVNPETSYRDGRQGSSTDFDREKSVNFKPLSPATAPASNSVWTWFAVAQGEVAILKVFGSDLKEGGVPERVELDINAGYLLTPESDDWPEDNPYRVVGGIRQSGFWARGNHVEHHRDGIVTFTCNTGGAIGNNGEVINQAFLMLYRFLNDFVEKDGGRGYRDGAFGPVETFADGRPKFHIAKFHEAQALSADLLAQSGGSPDAGSPGLGFIGKIFVIEPTPLSEILRRFFDAFGGHLTSHRGGAVYPYLVDPTTDAASGQIYRERYEIGRLVSHEFAWAEQENRITYDFLYSPDQDLFGVTKNTLEDEDSIAAHGGESIGVFQESVKQCYYGNDAATTAARWQMALDLYAFPPRYVTWATDLTHVQQDNGDEVRFTHRKEGIGLTGETGTPGVLMSMTYTEQPKELVMRVRLLDAVLLADGSFDELVAEDGSDLVPD